MTDGIAGRAFTVFPAVDIAGGRCVQLRRGDPEAATVYYDDPVEAALRWVSEGAQALHVVDLDAALGRGRNAEVIARLVAAVPVPVQVAGGVRDEGAFIAALETGAARVVLGTAAVDNPRVVASLARAHPHRVVVAADVRDREVVVGGWTRGSGVPVDQFVPRVELPGVAALLITDVARDGVLEGPACDLYREVAQMTEVPVIASGGVRDPDDVAAVREAGASGVVIGTALYEGRLSLAQCEAAASR